MGYYRSGNATDSNNKDFLKCSNVEKQICLTRTCITFTSICIEWHYWPTFISNDITGNDYKLAIDHLKTKCLRFVLTQVCENDAKSNAKICRSRRLL